MPDTIPRPATTQVSIRDFRCFHNVTGIPIRPINILVGGRVIEFSDTDIECELGKLNSKTLRSNDVHIVALARVSGARLLFSRDADLHADFKNKKLIKPKGKVYKSPLTNGCLMKCLAHVTRTYLKIV